MKPKIKKRPQSVLGLTLADGQLRAFHLTRAKGRLEVVKAASAALTLDLLHPEPELIGREIKNHFDAAGIRERHVIVGIPPRWIMTQHAKVPDLSPQDTTSFLEIEAEKGFPVDPAQLQICASFQRSGGERHVTQLAVRKEQTEQLSTILKAAGLKPVSFALGLAELPEAHPPSGTGRAVLAVEPTGVTLLVAVGGGIAMLRTFEATVDAEAGENVVNAASIARELRITLEQVPAELRTELRELFITGDSTMVRQLADSLAAWAKGAGLAITRGDLPGKNLPAAIAERLAARWLEGTGPELEFLPPRPSRWTVMMARYSSKRLATAGFAAAGLVVAAAAAFGWQEYRRWSLRAEWSEMQAQVTALETVQARIREYRPWYDTSYRSLSVLKRVTECFPENGTVTARTIEIRNNSIVNISGTARDSAALLRVQDQLRQAKEIQGLKIEKISGKTPMQFILTFRWNAPTSI